MTMTHNDNLHDDPTSTPDDESWDEETLPPPRARLMTPLTWALVILLSVGGGFALGAHMEKAHANSVAQAAFSAQLNQIRGRGGFGGAGAGAGGGGASGSGGQTGAPSAATAAGPAATGTIQLIDGRKVYVTDAQGNIAIVVAPARLDISALKTGQHVVVQGTTSADGTIAATAITTTQT
ncbi:MAG: hypothetical protein ACXV7I_13000 [Ilumatobacteraceae bacterium]